MHRIMAVAANTVRQALRMKVAVAFIVMLLVLLPLLALGATGDGTPKGRLQTFISYGMSLTSLLLSLLTIFVMIHTTTSDLVSRQVYTVLTKPIRRYEFLLGKYLGVLGLDLVLLVGFTAMIYAIAVLAPGHMDMTDPERAEIHDQFFTARASLKAPEPEVLPKEIDRAYDKLVKGGQLDEFFPGAPADAVKNRLRIQMALEKRAVPVGKDLTWEFRNVRLVEPNEPLFVRFKYDVSVNPPDLHVYSLWAAGDLRQLQGGLPVQTRIYAAERRDVIRTFREFQVPGDAVAKDGYLAVAFQNVPLNSTVVIFPVGDGLEVMYKADTFTANFVRGVAMIGLRLVFLASVGLFAASFLSFPVAVLLCLVVFVTCTVSGFVCESFTVLSGQMGLLYKYTLDPVVKTLPQFDTYNPSTYLVKGRLIDWSTLGRVLIIMGCVWPVLLVSAGLGIFGSREIARTTV